MKVYIVIKTVGYRNMDIDSPIEEIDSIYLDENKASTRLLELDKYKEYQGFINWIETHEVTE